MADLLRAHALDGMLHGFFGRGSSTDDKADPQAGAANRRRSADRLLPGAPIAINHQVHGPHCRIIDGPFDPEARPEADALATRQPGVLLGIHTADCAPVLLADAAAGVVGAAHAGWRGALEGVTDAVIAAMEQLGAARARISAAVGPCIARASYEVDDAFFARFIAADPANAGYFQSARPGHHHFDLPGYVARRLADAGLARVELVACDTCQSDAHWSHRRGTLNAAPESGRQISLIGLPRG